MTKEKILADIVKYSATAKDKRTKKLTPQFYYGNNWIINGFCAYKDADMPTLEMESTLHENVISTADNLFADNTIRELSNAIEIDIDVLKAWIKKHRRNDSRKVPFVIGIKKENDVRYVCVNGWYLRNQFEYLKDNYIFIQPEKFKNSSGNKVYYGGIYSFSKDFTIKCITLPVFCRGPIKVDYMIEEKKEYNKGFMFFFNL